MYCGDFVKTLLLIRLAGYDTFVVVTWIVQRNIQIATRHMQCHLKVNDYALNRSANHSIFPEREIIGVIVLPVNLFNSLLIFIQMNLNGHESASTTHHWFLPMLFLGNGYCIDFCKLFFDIPKPLLTLCWKWGITFIVINKNLQISHSPISLYLHIIIWYWSSIWMERSFIMFICYYFQFDIWSG